MIDLNTLPASFYTECKSQYKNVGFVQNNNVH